MATTKSQTKEGIVETAPAAFSAEQVQDMIKAAVESAVNASAMNMRMPQAPIVVQKDDANIVKAERALKEKQRQFNNFVNGLISGRGNYRTITIPKVYRKWTGDITAGLNGVVIKVKADGRPYRVHKSFVPIIINKLRYVDDKVSTMQSGGDVRYSNSISR